MKKETKDELSRVKQELIIDLERLFGAKNLKEFKNFAFKGHMIQMSIAFILGAAFNDTVKSLSQNILMPIINVMVSHADGEWRELKHEVYDGLVINTGLFLDSFVNFIIVAIVLFFLYKSFMPKIEDNK